MKFNEHWLREWVNPAVTSLELAEQLTMAGLEVDAMEPVAAEFSGVVVGKVMTVAAHPQADRLQVCQVDVGLETPLTIVCGARNVAIGMYVPTACIGANLPGDLKIKKTKLRGVESQGMLCSAAELGLIESADGLLVLDDDAQPGVDIREYLSLDDVSIELGLTPNRSDCLSIAGVARETAVLNRCVITGPQFEPVVPMTTDTFSVQVEAAAACPRYLGRVISNIKQARTPLWLQERLRRCGLRSISPVVDVMNYVMLELGQPMHAFDLEKLDGSVIVRMADANESLTLLDDQSISLRDDTVVIADRQGPLAIAGVMGGRDSAVSGSTTSLFLESAYFAPQFLSGKARSYGLHTDSSHRFERGVDPELPRQAMERATQLLLKIVGGQAGEIIEVVDSDHLPGSAIVSLRQQRLERVLGMSIARDEVSDILGALGMTITEESGDSWQIMAPSYRFDIAIEADLIEEVARVHGYNALPIKLPKAQMSIVAGHDSKLELQQRLSHILTQRDYQEAICYSFIAEEIQQILDPEREAIKLANPISADLTVMRTSLWPGLVQSLQYNLNRQHRRVRLFETGVQFNRVDGAVVEEKMIAGVACGEQATEQWGKADQRIDFFDIKADMEALLSVSHHVNKLRFEASNHPALHPGQSAMIVDEKGAEVGLCGLLHPSVLAGLSLDRDVFVFELRIDAAFVQAIPKFKSLSRFPAIRRDIALLVSEDVQSSQIQAVIANVAGDLLRESVIFDVYRGKGIDSGAKSLAIGLTLQEFSRTLTDDEVEALVANVLTQLNKTLGATLRE